MINPHTIRDKGKDKGNIGYMRGFMSVCRHFPEFLQDIHWHNREVLMLERRI